MLQRKPLGAVSGLVGLAGSVGVSGSTCMAKLVRCNLPMSSSLAVLVQRRAQREGTGEGTSTFPAMCSVTGRPIITLPCCCKSVHGYAHHPSGIDQAGVWRPRLQHLPSDLLLSSVLRPGTCTNSALFHLNG